MTNPANAASREARAHQAEFLRDLAARIFRHAAPLKHFDQGDTDQLYIIASALADEAASQPREGVEALIAAYRKAVVDAEALRPRGPRKGSMEAYQGRRAYEMRLRAELLAAFHDTAPTDQAQRGGEVEATCDLCVGECRTHPLFEPAAWVPEPGSRAALAQSGKGVE